MPDSDVQRLLERVESLEVRVRTSEDMLAIQNLKARYGQLADDRYDKLGPKSLDALEPIAREIASLFTEDGVWDGGKALGSCRGRDEIFDRMMKPTLHFSWHYFVKPQIEVDGDRATATWDILAACTAASGEAMWMSGVEHDVYCRVDGVWLHERMKLRTVFLAPYKHGWAQR